MDKFKNGADKPGSERQSWRKAATSKPSRCNSARCKKSARDAAIISAINKRGSLESKNALSGAFFVGSSGILRRAQSQHPTQRLSSIYRVHVTHDSRRDTQGPDRAQSESILHALASAPLSANELVALLEPSRHSSDSALSIWLRSKSSTKSFDEKAQPLPRPYILDRTHDKSLRLELITQ